MVFRLLGAALLASLLAPAANAASGRWSKEAQAARAALVRSVKADHVDPGDQRRYLGILSHARVVHRRVPPLRKRILENVLAQVAAPKSPTGPRALSLYTTLQENADYLAANRVPASGTDVTGADGVLYRAFGGDGLQFHPLANAGRLNSLLAAGDLEGARALGDALVARAEQRPGGALAWEYWFDYGYQRAPWTSGMAQAVMAQALARAGNLDAARRAYRAIPDRLARDLPAGPWIRLYSGSGLVVLNAQLQSAISLGDYAELARDDAAATLADRLLKAARTMLPLFDTGHWSRYSPGVSSDLGYHEFVISLLKRIGTRTGDTVWQDAAARFERYETEPPLMTGTSASRVLYPRPQDGLGDTFVVRFFLSKISKVALVVDGTAVDGATLSGGVHTFRFSARDFAVGEHSARLVAHSLDGNPGATELGSFEVLRDDAEPDLAASKAAGRVYWRAKDGESACCRIRLELHKRGKNRVIVADRAKAAASIPPGYWSVTVVATDAAGNRAEQRLGLVVGRTR